MMPLSLAGAERLLCLGAHCDDIEIGAGGTILGALARNPELEVAWVVCASNEERRAEARRSADAFLGKAARKRVVVQEFRESYFPWAGDELKSFLEEVKRDFLPDVVLTHWRGDRHQDHRTLGELTWNAFRDQVILEYEIPKWDGDLGRPNVYVPVSEEHARQKVETLMTCFESQAGKDWFTEDLFLSLLRLRGMECRSPSNYAEAYYASKLLLDGVAGP